MATKIICDYCGEEVKETFSDYRGDLNGEHLAIIEIKPVLLKCTDSKVVDPDLCRKCIIKALRG